MTGIAMQREIMDVITRSKLMPLMSQLERERE